MSAYRRLFARAGLIVLGLACALSSVQHAAAVGLSPHGRSGAVGQDPVLRRLYVAQPASNSVLVLNSRSMALLGVLRVPPAPSAIAVDAGRHRLYVASDSAGVLSVFDEHSLHLVRTVALGGYPSGLMLIDRGRDLLLTGGISGAIERLPLFPTPGRPIAVAALDAVTTLLLAPASASSGQSVLAFGGGYTPGEPVDLSWGVTRLAVFHADSTGTLMGRFRVPRHVALGPYLVILMGRWSTRTLSTLLTVIPAPPPPRHAKSPATKPPTMLQKILTPRLVLPVPAMLARGPLQKLLGKDSQLRLPVMAIEAALLVPCSVLLLRRRRRRVAKAHSEAKARNEGRKRGGKQAPAMTPRPSR